MAEQTLLDRIARTNAYPANQPLPAAWLDEVLDAHTQGSKTMSTTQKIRSVEPEATPPTPRRWKGAIAAIAVLVAAIATTVIMTGDGEGCYNRESAGLPGANSRTQRRTPRGYRSVVVGVLVWRCGVARCADRP